MPSATSNDPLALRPPEPGRNLPRPAPEPDIAVLGQVFTPPAIVERMLALMRNRGSVLDPACGDGAFSQRLSEQQRKVVAIELDPRFCPAGALNLDFFAYPETNRFDSIIGNPPYVKARDILPQTAVRPPPACRTGMPTCITTSLKSACATSSRAAS